MDTQHPSALIRSFERLFSLTPAERAHLERLTADVREVEPRRKLLDEGKTCDGLGILTSGWLVEYKLLRDGGRQILNFRLPGDIVGLECLAYKYALHTTATLTGCTIAPFAFAAFQQVQRDFPRLASGFFLMTLRQGAILHEWEVDLGRRSAFARLAHLILELDRRLRIRGFSHDGSVPFPLTQEEIADSTGLSVPYVNRILKQMRSEGLIRLGDRALEVREPATLAKAAGFKPDYVETWGQGWLSCAEAHS